MRLQEIHAMQVRGSTTKGVSYFVDVLEYFTCGRCWELAEALSEIVPTSRIIEIRVCNGAWNMLVHSGIEVGGTVIDIEGAHDSENWLKKWTSSWDNPAISYRGGRGELLGFDTRRTMEIARHIGNALIDAVAPALRNSDMKKAA